MYITPILHTRQTAKRLATCPGQYRTAIRVCDRNQEHLNSSIFTEVSRPGLNLKNSILNLFKALETKGRYQAYTTWVSSPALQLLVIGM